MIAADELDAFIRLDGTAFGAVTGDKDLEEGRLFLEPARCAGAFEDQRLIGAAATLSLQLAVPGGRVAAAGVTWVGVDPTRRRRGVLRSLMRHQLDSYHRSGEAVAALGASESAIYRRFGYGPASRIAPIDIERAHATLLDAPPPPGDLVLADVDTVLRDVPALYDRLAAERNGMFSRSIDHWRALLRRASETRGEDSAAFLLLHRDARGSADGYAAYRMASNWSSPHGLSGLVVKVSELFAADGDAYRALWQHLLTLDLANRVVAHRRPVQEPLEHLLVDPRRLRRGLLDDFHIRIVDVERAFAARRYAREDVIVLEVHDAFCPWTEGRYRLEGGLEGATCSRTTDAADLAMDVVALGAAYLGDTLLPVLAGAGMVQECTPGALRRGAAMLSWPEPPFSPQMF